MSDLFTSGGSPYYLISGREVPVADFNPGSKCTCKLKRKYSCPKSLRLSLLFGLVKIFVNFCSDLFTFEFTVKW